MKDRSLPLIIADMFTMLSPDVRGAFSDWTRAEHASMGLHIAFAALSVAPMDKIDLDLLAARWILKSLWDMEVQNNLDRKESKETQAGYGDERLWSFPRPSGLDAYFEAIQETGGTGDGSSPANPILAYGSMETMEQIESVISFSEEVLRFIKTSDFDAFGFSRSRFESMRPEIPATVADRQIRPQPRLLAALEIAIRSLGADYFGRIKKLRSVPVRIGRASLNVSFLTHTFATVALGLFLYKASSNDDRAGQTSLSDLVARTLNRGARDSYTANWEEPSDLPPSESAKGSRAGDSDPLLICEDAALAVECLEEIRSNPACPLSVIDSYYASTERLKEANHKALDRYCAQLNEILCDARAKRP